MKLKKIIYVSKVTLPTPRRNANTIQIVRTAVAFANQNVAVDLFVGRNKFTDTKKLSEYFGVQIPPSLRIKTLPPVVRQSKIGVAIFIALKSFFEKSVTVVYIRGRVAKEIIKLKWLHRLPVFVESHQCINSSFAYLKKESRLSKSKDNSAKIDERKKYIYRNSDGLVCIFKEIIKFINSISIKTPTIFAWYGTKPDSNFNYSFSRREGIYYTGSFYKTYIDTLVEAMKYVKDEKLVLIGGGKEDISRVKHQAKNLGILERVEFRGYVPPGEIKNCLRSAKVVVSLFWGLKLSDYLSCGLPMVVPDVPPVREVLNDGENCVMFQHYNPESLASAINKVLENPTIAETLARNAYKTAQEYNRHKRAEKVVNFIESNI